ncbi:ABC transporter ATP-binding protein [Micromonospora sp. NPDC048830]|uniref:ABC transporter ATP-binding protein n=1 Tax=Micromonospora sp. NPDC048830 TaxID=3364257 RepID=UPI003723C32F
MIEISAVSKTYNTRSGDVVALDDVSMTVRPGEFVSLVGPSGCGKSTLLRMISGLEGITSGRIERTEEMVNSTIGMVFQSAALMPWRRLLDNVLLPVQLKGRIPESKREHARELLTIAGLAGFENKYPFELSGGMQQRVSICRALINDPDILLMDEPFGALDALTRDDMSALLLSIWEKSHKTVIFVTHSIEEAVLLSDTVYVMSARPGRISRRFDVDIPRPRLADVKYSQEFAELAHRIRDQITQDGDVAAARHSG